MSDWLGKVLAVLGTAGTALGVYTIVNNGIIQVGDKSVESAAEVADGIAKTNKK